MPRGKKPTHGHNCRGRRSRTYETWLEMRRRVNRADYHGHARYKALGVTVCDRWASSFPNFLADMGERPEGLTLDRTDNTLGYEPDNCRWATPREQSRNRRSCNMTIERAVSAIRAVQAGETQTAVAARLGVSLQTIHCIVHGRSWPEARELTSRANASNPEQ